MMYTRRSPGLRLGTNKEKLQLRLLFSLTTTKMVINTSIVARNLVSWTSSRRSFVTPVALARTLASFHPIIRWNSQSSRNTSRNTSRRFSCNSAASPQIHSAATTDSSNGNPIYSRLLPCPSQNRPPRIEHLVVSEGGTVLEYITKALDLPPLFVTDLIHFGAVYYAPVCPKPPPTATLEQIKLYKEVTTPSALSKRSSIKGKPMQEAKRTFRINHVDEFVEAGTYLRVHVHPKRFPRCYEIDWRSRIIAVTEDYVVLDKPAGTSVGGTTDNIEESCVTFATCALGLTDLLKTTHQIDNCTEGCVVLARTKEYCSVFHRKIREKKVKKLYLAITAAPVPIGVITHYMRPINIAPRLISEEYTEGWYLCQLEVLECKKVPWPNAEIVKKYSVQDCGWPSKEFAYECKISLLTGRTHQIRAQLAASGAPILGDSMYMPAASAEISSPGLDPYGKYRKQYASTNDRELAVEEWIARHGKEHAMAIGLQACQISWDNGEHFYEARSPWWR